jgi:hypothetical protein
MQAHLCDERPVIDARGNHLRVLILVQLAALEHDALV